MDWSKAKTILIITFIIINLMLGYTILKNEDVSQINQDEVFVEDAKKLLSKKDIKVNTEIPTDNIGRPPLIVEFEFRKPEHLNFHFFNNEGEIENIEKNKTIISKESEEIELINKKTISYTNKDSRGNYNISGKSDIMLICKDFLKARGFSVKDINLDYLEEIGEDRYLVKFSKKYNDIYVEKAYTNFVVTNKGVESMERVWLSVLNESEQDIYIDSAAKSILELLSMEDTYGHSIEEIAMSYVFDPDNHEGISESSLIKQGKAMPSWRVKLDNGDIKILFKN